MTPQELFWNEFYELGEKAGAKFPDCLAAQAALESGWGEKTSGKYNYFGIKGSPGTIVETREVYNGQEVMIHAEFKDFTTKLECVGYLVDRWYKDYKGYKGVNRAESRNECARLLQEESYATDPVYANLLISLMDRYATEAPAPEQPEPVTDSFLPKAAKYYNEEPHQDRAWNWLESQLTAAQLEEFKSLYRNQGAPTEPTEKFPLQVPYFYQYDSATGHGGRMCFSSSMAMALDYIDPEKLDGDDDWYLNIVLYYGDTVSSDAQIKAARSLGYDAEFHMDGTLKALEALLDRSIPVPVGILHHGFISSPTGGGHWITLVGHDETHFDVHDPAGELDLINGGYPKTGPEDGKFQRYSKKNLLRRWLIASDHDGWYVDLS